MTAPFFFGSSDALEWQNSCVGMRKSDDVLAEKQIIVPMLAQYKIRSTIFFDRLGLPTVRTDRAYRTAIANLS
jgi:hypothetical protein